MIRIQLNLDPQRESLYEEAVSRLPEVELIDRGPDALITAVAAEAGASSLPTLLDQPEACGLDELAALAPARLMPAHQWRFDPSVIPIHHSNANGHLGEPGLLRIHHWLTDNVPATRAAFAQIDLAHWIFGTLPNQSHFLARSDYLQAHLGYPNDGMALIDLATNRPGPDSYYSMHLIGSSGAAYADDHRNAHLLFGNGGSRALLPGQNRLLGIQNMLQEFVAGIVDDRAWSVSVQDSVNALTTIKEAADV